VNKLFLRREFLKFAGAAAVTLPAWAQHSLPRSNDDGQATLDTGRWEEAARQRIEGVIRQLGACSPGYVREHPPYAVFDWDNASMAGHPVDRDALVEDIADDYRELGTLPAAAHAQSKLLLNFRAKLLFFYAGLDASYGPRVAYPGDLPIERLLVKIALSSDRRADLL
jgi:hypothetical protein